MKKIAVIISQLEESCQSHIWDGIESAAKELSVELVTFTAYSLDSDDQIKAHYKMFQSFITESQFDGVILFTGAMSEYTPWPVVKKYVESIELPLVTIAGSVGAGTDIIINNHSGIIELVTHLVEEHNKRNIAFIKGPESNEEAQERFSAYIEALEQNELEYDPKRTHAGDFSEEAGIEAVKYFIENDIFLDAVVCVDDFTALGAMKALRKAGVEVPHEVAVVGFDDIPEASMTTPALTTIQQPFFLQGETALESLLDLINLKNEQEVDERESGNTVMLNAHAVFRSSCGCTAEEVRQFRENWHAERANMDRSFLSEFRLQLEPLIAYQLLEDHLQGRLATEFRQFVIKGTENLWNSFFDEVEAHSTSKPLLDTLTEILDHNAYYTKSVTIWDAVLSNLGPFTFHFTEQKEQLLAHAILDEARIALDAYQKRTIQISSFEKMSIDESIRESCTSIITSGTQEELLNTTIKALEEHDFDFAFLALFNSYSPIQYDEWRLPSQLVGQFVIENGDVKQLTRNDQQVFSSDSYLPEEVQKNLASKNTLFLPIYTNQNYFGYLVVNIIPDAPKELYSELQIHISSAYKSCFMMDNLRALSMNDELTGLSNRRGFMLLANQLHARTMNSGIDLLVFYFDMDNLKKVNDNYSHEEGDKAIKATASLLKRTFRNHDIIGRLGGDEFVAVIEETVPGLSKIMEKRLRDLTNTYNTHSGYPYKIEMSLGTATLKSNSEESIETVIREADHAMFSNKRERKKGRS